MITIIIIMEDLLTSEKKGEQYDNVKSNKHC